MNCFPCFRSQKSKKARNEELDTEVVEAKSPEPKKQRPSTSESSKNMESNAQVENKNINAQTFTFRELASATKNFRQETLLGEGGFGRVYKGTLPATGQIVAVKQLDRNGLQGNKEFLVEVLMLSQLHHDHLVKLVGYCADGDQRLLVYEYMPGGSVEDHLLDLKEGAKPLDWMTRMKIAYGAAQGLEYLHDKANPPVIYRDLKSSNILLLENFHPKLSDFGLAKLSPAGDSKMHMSSRVMGTYGYCAPEYSRNGNLTVKSDVYSFGVVLLELITGRRAVDTTKPVNEQNLVSWAQPIFRDPKRFPDMADPLLERQFPETGLNQAVAIAAMCLQEEPGARPLMSDVMTALSFLANSPDTATVASPLPSPSPAPAPAPPPAEEKSENNDVNGQDSKHSNVKDEKSKSSDESKDGSEYDDGESGEHEDANSATNSEVDNSDDDTDSSDYQETENIVDESTEENKDEHQKSIKRNSISSRKNSRQSSIRKSPSGNESSKNISQDGSNISRDITSSSGSDKSGKSESKKSPLSSSSRKSSKGSKADGTFRSSKKPHTKSLSSKSYRKSKKTKDVPATLSLKKPLDVRDSHKCNHQGLSDACQAELC